MQYKYSINYPIKIEDVKNVNKEYVQQGQHKEKFTNILGNMLNNKFLNNFSLYFYKIKTLFKILGTKTFQLKYCPSLETTFSHLSGSI